MALGVDIIFPLDNLKVSYTASCLFYIYGIANLQTKRNIRNTHVRKLFILRGFAPILGSSKVSSTYPMLYKQILQYFHRFDVTFHVI